MPRTKSSFIRTEKDAQVLRVRQLLRGRGYDRPALTQAIVKALRESKASPVQQP